MTTMEYHNPVLLNETVEGLNIKPDGIYVDVTFGGGGHSKAILEQLSEKGTWHEEPKASATQKVIPCKWVFRIKYSSSSNPTVSIC